MEEENLMHSHCLNCYAMNCFQHPDCQVIYCKNHCGLKLHACKITEHEIVCTKQTRQCPNKMNGCPFKVDSISVMNHLEYCPASVVVCGMSWNRYPLYSKIREQWLPFTQGNPVSVKGDLDTEFALSDQQYLNEEMMARMRKGVKNIKNKAPKLDLSRLAQLEELLKGTTNSRISDVNEGNMTCSTGRKRASDDVKELEVVADNDSEEPHDDDDTDTDDDDDDDDDDMVSIDVLEAVDSTNIATVVSSTDIRTAYYDVPAAYRELPSLLSRKLLEHKEIKSDYTIDEENFEFTDDQKRQCIEIYSKLNVLGKQLGLNVVVETMPKFQNQYPMYSFSCSKVFRRNEFSSHCKNIHGDIQSSLSGHLMLRCPLAIYGCPFIKFRLKPKDRTIRFSRMFRTFTTIWDVNNNIVRKTDNDINSNAGLLDLPYECLCYLMAFLDSVSLNSVIKTCRFLRDVCYSLLDNRGIILTLWKKKVYEDSGTASWKEDKKIRFFSTASSPINHWDLLTGDASMGEHLHQCPFFVRNRLQKPIKLAASDEMKKELLEPYTPGVVTRVEQRDYWVPRTPEESDSENEEFEQHAAM